MIADIQETPESLRTGYKSLDNVVRIPQGAITIIAGRPSHGKTTFQYNLLLNMLRTYQDKKFYFFSYEEAKRSIALKLIMNLAGVELNQEFNFEALLQRNLIYTAVTRGKKLVVIVGSKKALAMGINNDKTKKRYTHLHYRLAEK